MKAQFNRAIFIQRSSVIQQLQFPQYGSQGGHMSHTIPAEHQVLTGRG